MRDWGGGGGGERGSMEQAYWGEARGAAKHSTMHMMVPQQRIPQPKTQQPLG